MNTTGTSAPSAPARPTPVSSWRDHYQAPACRRSMPIGLVGQHWLAAQERRGRRSMRDAQSAVTRHIVEALGDLDCRSVTKEVVTAWVAALQKDGYAPATIVRLRSYLSCVLQHAVSLGAADANVVRELPRGILPTRRAVDPGRGAAEVLSLDEIGALLSCEELPISRRLIWGVALLGGLRFGELAALRWGDLSVRTPLDELRVARSWDCRARVERLPKSGLIRRVPVHPVVADLIARVRALHVARHGEAPQPKALLCPCRLTHGSETPWHDTSALKWWRRDLEVVGIPDPASGPRRLHSTRHTYVTQLVEAGVPDRVWQTLTHVPPDVGGRDAADTYAHPSWQTLCQAVLRLEVPA